MSKYSEALERIWNCYVANQGNDLMCCEEYSEDYDLIKEAISKAEKYDELTKEYKPSPVLEKVKMLKQERDEALKQVKELQKELIKEKSYSVCGKQIKSIYIDELDYKKMYEELEQDNATLTKLVWSKYGTSLTFDGATKEVLAKYEDDMQKRIEELELSCSYKNEEIRQISANLKACEHLADKNIELHKRISELEHTNKVLVDGANIVKKNVFIFGNDEDGYELCPKHEYDQCITNQEYKKYNAMLELVEVEE